MINSVERQIEGMIATLRADVIPHVSDAYARGQAIGVIDLLNGLAPRIEWRQAPIRAAIRRRQAVIDATQLLLSNASAAAIPVCDPETATAADLQAVRDALDAEICALVRVAFGAEPADAARLAAQKLLRRHMQEDIAEEMALTRKPLFAEIATGGDAAEKSKADPVTATAREP